MRFEVTGNLFDALDDLRHDSHPLRLWADAICINQSNMAERNKQVGLMRQIYSFAQFTVIYLGKSNVDCDEAMDAVHDVRLDSRLRNITVTQILSRTWFKRVWIYQELVLSRVPWVQCGRRRVKWGLLHTALFGKEDDDDAWFIDRVDTRKPEVEENRNLLDSEKNLAIKIFSEMHAAWKRKSGPPTLLSVLSSRRGFGVKDERDFIYGHLAVADLPSRMNYLRPCPIVDYERSVVDVFTDAAKFMLWNPSKSEACSWDLLSYVDTCNTNPHIKGLPSWVPDWTLDSTDYLSTIPFLRSNFSHSAPNSTTVVPRFPAPHLCSDKMYLVGVVERVSSVIISKTTSKLEIQDMISNLQIPNSFKKLQRQFNSLPAHPSQAEYDSLAKKLIQKAAHPILFPDYDDYCLIPEMSNNQDAFDAKFPDRHQYSIGDFPLGYQQTGPRDYRQVHNLKSGFPDFFQGRKLASIGSSSWLAVVPSRTCATDVLFAVPRDQTKSFDFLVLRPLARAQLGSQILDDGGGEGSKVEISDAAKIPGGGHFTLVGRGLLQERPINGEFKEDMLKEVILH